MPTFNLSSMTRGVACTASSAKVVNDSSVFTVLAANDNRAGFIIENDSGGAAVKIKFGSAAAADDYTFLLAAGARYECPAGAVYVGVITGIAASVSGALRVTELTATGISIG
jgi:hypothetical protein